MKIEMSRSEIELSARLDRAAAARREAAARQARMAANQKRRQWMVRAVFPERVVERRYGSRHGAEVGIGQWIAAGADRAILFFEASREAGFYQGTAVRSGLGWTWTLVA